MITTYKKVQNLRPFSLNDAISLALCVCLYHCLHSKGATKFLENN